MRSVVLVRLPATQGRKPAKRLASDAAARLSALLPRLGDIRITAVDDHHLEVPAHLFGALHHDFPPDQAATILKELQLDAARPLTAPERALRWLREPTCAKEAPPPHWHLELCHARLAPGDRVANWGMVSVGIVDTGYTEHVSLGFPGQTWVKVDDARSFDALSGPPGMDCMRGLYAGHGTATASLCAGDDPGPQPEPEPEPDAGRTATPRPGPRQDFQGVAPRVPLVPVRVGQSVLLDQRPHDFEAAVRYLVEEAKVQIINVSMGTALAAQAPEPMRRATERCYESGVLLIAAAGNLPVPGWPAYPAALPHAIAVAGVTRRGRPWGLSSSGTWVDIAAPASELRRAFAGRGTTSNYVTSYGGTSCATAMVSGAAARWLHARHGQLDAYCGWRRVEAFRQVLRASATCPLGWQPDAGYGAGILNVEALLTQPLPCVRGLTRR